MTLSLRRQPDFTGSLAAQQREEDERAAAWVEGELGRELRRRIGYTGTVSFTMDDVLAVPRLPPITSDQDPRQRLIARIEADTLTAIHTETAPRRTP